MLQSEHQLKMHREIKRWNFNAELMTGSSLLKHKTNNISMIIAVCLCLIQGAPFHHIELSSRFISRRRRRRYNWEKWKLKRRWQNVVYFLFFSPLQHLEKRTINILQQKKERKIVWALHLLQLVQRHFLSSAVFYLLVHVKCLQS